LAALFAIGFKWNFLATKGFEDMRWMSGYTLMAIWSGYLFVEKYIPYKMVAGTNGQWIVYYILKLLLFVVIGVFTAPFTCLWAVFRVIRLFGKRYKHTIKKKEYEYAQYTAHIGGIPEF